MIKAAIFMGDPRRIPGLSYNVGIRQASGVSVSSQISFFEFHSHSFSDERNSLLRAPVASTAHVPARSNLTTTRQTLTVVMATTETPIRATVSDLLGLEWSRFKGRMHSIP